MKIHTFTVVVGTPACTMRCPYCVSKMTPEVALEPKQPNMRNFHIACRFAEISNVSTILYTGKGEPTLYPHLITNYLQYMMDNRHRYSFPFQELQTNGTAFDPQCLKNNIVDFLPKWYNLGLTLVCLSIGHYDPVKNNEWLRPIEEQFNFWRAAEEIHKAGLSVRLNCTLFREGIDSIDKLQALLASAKRNGIEQLTVRMVSKPDTSENEEVVNWVRNHQYDDKHVKEWLDSVGTPLLDLPHGARVYDVQGQNICHSNCLTETTDREDIRQMIYFPNGSLRYSWSFPGAVIL